MGRVYAHSNVHSSCIRILEQKGYQLQCYDEGDGYLWEAKLGAYRFLAHNPVELLGLVGIYEYKGMPKEAGEPYWWTVKGDSSVRDYLDAATPFSDDGELD